jgi:WD40 repeat protein
VEVLRIPELKGAVAIAFAPDGTLLAVAGPENVTWVWDVAKHQKVGTLEGHTDAVMAVAFSYDGTLLTTGSADRTIRFWDLATCQQVAILEGHEGPVTGMAFSPDGHTLAAVGGGKLRLWHIVTGEELPRLTDPQWLREREAGRTVLAILTGIIGLGLGGGGGGVSRPPPSFTVAFSADGRFLAMTVPSAHLLFDYDLQIRDLTSEDVVSIDGQFFAFAFSPDGKYMATAGNGIKFWDPYTGKRIIPGK